LAAGAYQFIQSFGNLPADLLFATSLATVVSFVSGYAVIAWLLRYLERGSYMPFVIWRIMVGIGLLALLSVGAV
jgi:undecaprenyl-diphosphatase